MSKSVTLAAALVVAVLCGCAGATRLPTRTRGPEGAHLENRLDLQFLDERGIRSEEVHKRFIAIDTGYRNPALFWGRWSDSKWGYWWIAVATPQGGAGDARRVWHAHNVLVAFDENGVVKSTVFVDNDAALWRELHKQLQEAPPLDLTQPVDMIVKPCCGAWEMSLTQDCIIIGTGKRKKPTVHVSPQTIVRISHNGVLDSRANDAVTCHTLHFKEKTALGRRVRFCADPGSVAALFQYLREKAPESLQWE
jgi:hypothetical protein